MQAFFQFFSTPQSPCLERRSIGNDVPAHSPAPSASCYSRNPDSAKTKHDLAAATDASVWICGPESLRSYSRTEDGVASTFPPHIPGRRPKDTPDSPLLFLAAR